MPKTRKQDAVVEKPPQAKPREIYTDGQGTGDVYQDGKPTIGTNAFGKRTVSTSPPSGGSDGDIWYQV